MIAIVDYNIGNLASVHNACKLIGYEAHIVKNPSELINYDKIILPGVGAFEDAMNSLKTTGMYDAVNLFAKTNKPILGICLGMQLLFDNSEEFGNNKGLGLISGKVIAFDKSKMNMSEQKIPHVGWNKALNNSSKLFEGLKDPYLYFVHSFHVVCDDKYVLASTNYGYDFVSVVKKDNIYGIQAHPEKSHDDGIKLLKNFLEL